MFKTIKKNQISEDLSHQKPKSLHIFDIKIGIKSILLVKELQQDFFCFEL